MPHVFDLWYRTKVKTVKETSFEKERKNLWRFDMSQTNTRTFNMFATLCPSNSRDELASVFVW